MSKKRRKSFVGKPAGVGFSADCGVAGHLAVRGDRVKALALIKKSLGKYRGRAQQYQLLCQGGDCLLGLRKVADAAKVYREAIEVAYEPSAARARIGLAKCLLAEGDHSLALEEIFLAIDAAGKAAKSGYTREGEGEWTLLAVPICPQGIAMRSYWSFLEAGQGLLGREIVDRAKTRAVGSAYRLGIFKGKIAEARGDLAAALKHYEIALASAVLGPRGLPALGGWCRCGRGGAEETLRQKLSCFRGKLSDRAILTSALNLRRRGRGDWTGVVGLKLSGQDEVAASAVLPLRIMMLGNRQRWGEMREVAEELLNVPRLSPEEGAAAVAAAVEAAWQEKGGDGGLEKLVRKAPSQSKARWAANRRLLYLGDGRGCEAFFRRAAQSTPAARACLGEALLIQGKREEANVIFNKLARRENDPARCREAAIVSLLATHSRQEEPPEGELDLIRAYAASVEERGGADGVVGLAGLAIRLRRAGRAKPLAEEIFARSLQIFGDVFFSLVDPKAAVRTLNAVNEAHSVFGGRGGIRDLYLSSAQRCLPMLASGGEGFYRYITSVYGDTFSVDLVGEANKLWDSLSKMRAIPPKWKSAKLLVEAESRVVNLQSRGIDLARVAYSTFGTGVFAARACYLIALSRFGEGGNPAGWAAAGMDSLGRARTESGNAGIVARLEVLGAGVDLAKLGKRTLKWRRRMSFQSVAERVVRDVARVESPVSA